MATQHSPVVRGRIHDYSKYVRILRLLLNEFPVDFFMGLMTDDCYEFYYNVFGARCLLHSEDLIRFMQSTLRLISSRGSNVEIRFYFLTKVLTEYQPVIQAMMQRLPEPLWKEKETLSLSTLSSLSSLTGTAATKDLGL